MKPIGRQCRGPITTTRSANSARDGVLGVVHVAVQAALALALRRHQHDGVAAAREERLVGEIVREAAVRVALALDVERQRVRRLDPLAADVAAETSGRESRPDERRVLAQEVREADGRQAREEAPEDPRSPILPVTSVRLWDLRNCSKYRQTEAGKDGRTRPTSSRFIVRLAARAIVTYNTAFGSYSIPWNSWRLIPLKRGTRSIFGAFAEYLNLSPRRSASKHVSNSLSANCRGFGKAKACSYSKWLITRWPALSSLSISSMMRGQSRSTL